jgi:hypothetical protein
VPRLLSTLAAGADGSLVSPDASSLLNILMKKATSTESPGTVTGIGILVTIEKAVKIEPVRFRRFDFSTMPRVTAFSTNHFSDMNASKEMSLPDAVERR